MKFHIRMHVICLLLILAGCSTPYQADSGSFFSEGGYSETRLGENVFRVTFHGNKYTGSGQVEEMALLRSAELALANGFKYFAIIQAKDQTSTGNYTAPTYGNTTTSFVGGQARSTTQIYGGQTYSMVAPGLSNTILCFAEKPTNAFAYDAQFIASELGRKYKKS